METLETLVQTNQLKMTHGKNLHPVVTYDKEFDALLITFEPTDNQEVVAHYVDGHVALLYRAESLEIVGLQIEDFALSFLPAHENVARLWQLKGTGEEISDMGDIAIYAQKRLPEVAKEVVLATEDVLGAQGQELIAALG